VERHFSPTSVPPERIYVPSIDAHSSGGDAGDVLAVFLCLRIAVPRISAKRGGDFTREVLGEDRTADISSYTQTADLFFTPLGIWHVQLETSQSIPIRGRHS